ncbi:MAG TPA: HI0074 family nucleotidyltransferase substrate-binding subunit [Candidatus Ozemobacteraceae bacterium]|nr:HI0074 family nucleotidyltransferase substrate-binding subunit [Candidatus Ozemobacteraceae bacterium]
MIDCTKFQKSLKHLERQLENYLRAKSRPELTPLDREAIAESVIQRFEVCYDTLWKDLKRYLIEELGLSEVPNSPKPILKLAGQNNLFVSSVEKWLEYANARTATAHDYSEEKAAEALKVMNDFVADAVKLYETISGETWK